MPFNYDPDAGYRYIGKVIKAREVTVQEFDELQGATLGAKLPPDEVIFFFQVQNLEDPTGKLRATFFRSESSPVSKWGRFKRGLKQLGIKVKRHQDGTTSLEGMYLTVEEKEIQVGKYGTANTFDAVELPAPEDIDTLLKRGAAEIVPEAANDIAVIIIGLADGLTEAQLTEQMAALGYHDGWQKVFAELKSKQSIVTSPEGILRVV